jgi:DNA invertase Pin-like site-specific DNA recombinase
MIERHPVAYIRRSVASRADPGDVSRDFQTEEVRKLAGAADLKIIDGDWGKSAATDKTDRRLAFLELLVSIEAAEVSELYAYSTDRLARSVEWSARLLNACRRAGVPIITREGRIEPGDAAAALLFNVLAAVNENALSGMEAKARATIATRKKRNRAAGRADNEGMGCAPYGTRHQKIEGRVATVPDPAKPLAPLMDAYAKAGSVFGAVRLLNEAELPGPRGHSWHATPLRHILERAGVPLPQPGPTGRRVPGRGSVLAQLVKCHCGHTMTPNNARAWLYCSKGQVNPKAHGRYYVNQRALMPAIREEAARLKRLVIEGDTDPEAVARLDERKRRLAIGFADDLLNEQQYQAELAKIAAEMAHEAARATIQRLPPMDWTAPVPDQNAYLRGLWEYIALDSDMNVSEIKWRVPEWRTP